MTTFTRPEASRYLAEKFGLNLSPNAIALLGHRGGGPVYERGRSPVRYTQAALDTWAADYVATTRTIVIRRIRNAA